MIYEGLTKELITMRQTSPVGLALAYILVLVASYFALIELRPISVLGDSYRIFFFHLPMSTIGFSSYTITLACSLLYLWHRDLRWDDLAHASVRLGLFFTILAMITGWAFAYEAWHTTWSWDPKVVTSMILALIYAAYLALRGGIDEPERRARSSAVLGIIGYLAVPLTYLSSQLWLSLHPTPSIGLEPAMWYVVGIMTLGIGIIYVYLLRLLSDLSGIQREYVGLMQGVA